MNNLQAALNDVLKDYTTELREAINGETDAAAERLKKAISDDAPVRTGKQKKSWKVTKRKIAGIDEQAIVHSTDYRKPHLLENGHLTRDGRTRTKPIHYISKNEERIIDEYERNVIQAIKAVK